MIVTFSWLDYALFGAMLMLSVLIGLYFGCCGRQDSIGEYLHGGKKMTVMPIAISVISSGVSGITLLGVPTDVYRFGSTYYLHASTILPLILITYYVYLPVFYKLQLISVYEYMMLRFDQKIRLLASGLSIVSALLYLPIVVYIPALALSQATQFSLHQVTFMLCGVCIFYTTIGGLKAVVWTDTLQFVVMMGSIVVVFFLGLKSIGGFGNMWTKAMAGKRLKFDFDPNPTKRDTVLATMVGTLFGGMTSLSIGQSFVQKFLSLPTKGDVKKALLWLVPGMFAIVTFVVLTGLIMYARYHDCDPFTAGHITKHDQILPYYVLDVAATVPGIAGLFLSGIFSAALSTLSACMNSLAGVVYADFVSPFMPKDITQKQVSSVVKLLVIMIGVISMAMVFVIEHMGSILPISFALTGMTDGPLLGVFTLGMLFPVANYKGALFGGMGGITFMSIIIVGNQYYQVMNKYVALPVSIEGCNDHFFNGTTITPHFSSSSVDKSDVFFLFRITHYYYGFVGTMTTIIIGLVVSYMTRKPSDPIVDPDLISPVSYWVANRFQSNKPQKGEYHIVKMGSTVMTQADS